MIVTLDCGCTVDDEVVSTFHYEDGGHYPLHTSPATYCKRCDLFKPCLCPPESTTESPR